MDILLQKMEGEVMQGGHRFGKRVPGKVQALQPVKLEGLRAGEEADGLDRQVEGMAASIRRTGAAHEGA